MMRAAASTLLSGFLLVGASTSGAQPPREPSDKFEGEITVALSTIVVRVVDTAGKPIRGLAPEDFRVRVGKTEIPVVAVDWIDAGTETLPQPNVETTQATETAPEETAAPPVPATSSGRLVVIFVQADLNPTRISGQLRMRPFTRELLDLLHPGDRVAVVSFDSHLKLWQDFTTDRQETQDTLGVAMLYSPEVDIRLSQPYSLARHFDFAAAHRAASPEKALEVTANALEALPGEKMLIMLGWGLGRYGAGGVHMTPDYRPAVKALSRAHASVFVLDVTSADFHSLEIGLQNVAEATGGAYFRTFRQPKVATESLAQTITGYYVLTLDQAALADHTGVVRIDLRNDKWATVLMRPVAVR